MLNLLVFGNFHFKLSLRKTLLLTIHGKDKVSGTVLLMKQVRTQALRLQGLALSTRQKWQLQHQMKVSNSVLIATLLMINGKLVELYKSNISQLTKAGKDQSAQIFMHQSLRV